MMNRARDRQDKYHIERETKKEINKEKQRERRKRPTEGQRDSVKIIKGQIERRIER